MKPSKLSTQRQFVKAQTFQTIIDDLTGEVKELAKGNLPAFSSVRDRINLVTHGKPFDLPRLAAKYGVEFTATNLRDLLLLFFPRMGLQTQVEMPVSVAMSDGEASLEEMSLFLSELSFYDPNGLFDSILFQRLLAYPTMKNRKRYASIYPNCEDEVSLSEHGIDFMDAARYVYLTYGYRLVKKGYPELNFRSHVRN